MRCITAFSELFDSGNDVDIRTIYTNGRVVKEVRLQPKVFAVRCARGLLVVLRGASIGA